MSRVLIAYDGGLAVLKQQDHRWIPQIHMVDKKCQCISADPRNQERIYCGTFDSGLWFSSDRGESWQPVSAELPHKSVMSVAVSLHEGTDGRGMLWAGTEPSAVFRSQDSGKSWYECSSLLDLPSRQDWSFPPRPWTHHVRWIEPDPNAKGRIFAGIELGGVMRSQDNGETWEDRKPNSQHDCHTLRSHPDAPGLIYEVAGGGFAESHDGGESWQRSDEGLLYHYLWGLAVDPGDPQVVVVSASPGPRSAHDNEHAQALLQRKSGNDPWQPVYSGLPEPSGTRAYVLASHESEPGVFFAVTRQELYRSDDGGLSWQHQDVAWPEDTNFTDVNAIVLTSEE